SDGTLTEATEAQLCADLRDLGLIGADLSARLGEKAGRRQALTILDEVEALFGPSRALYLQREALYRALGHDAEAAEAGRRAKHEELTPRTAWDHYAVGRTLLQAGDLAGAARELQQAVELQPGDFWPNFYRGVCAYRRERYPEALTAFSVCVALAPGNAECYYNRALVLAAQDRTEPAVRDYGKALEYDPHLAAAAL